MSNDSLGYWLPFYLAEHLSLSYRRPISEHTMGEISKLLLLLATAVKKHVKNIGKLQMQRIDKMQFAVRPISVK